ncbi:MAG TPA: cytochrome c [Xanthobacteraceae bacterium]
MIRALLIAAVLGLGATAVIAQSDPLKQRNATMYQMGEEAYDHLYPITKGEAPYEQAKVDAAFAKIAELAPTLPPLWPPGSTGKAEGSDYHSAPKVWQNKADFDARLAKVIKDVNDNRDKVKNLDQLRTVYDAIVERGCNACHEEYRVRN